MIKHNLILQAHGIIGTFKQCELSNVSDLVVNKVGNCLECTHIFNLVVSGNPDQAKLSLQKADAQSIELEQTKQ